MTARPYGLTINHGILLLGALAGLFLLGFDQGQALGVFQGSVAYDQNVLHEAFHDLRHVVGVPCH
ncbi:MAG: CbtB-domain containing protein [Chloroflexi bacterium]|nr:CbtB-domain containing protein [Chloroflexota bacterium]